MSEQCKSLEDFRDCAKGFLDDLKGGKKMDFDYNLMLHTTSFVCHLKENVQLLDIESFKTKHKDRIVDYHQLNNITDKRSSEPSKCKKLQGDNKKVISLIQHWNKVASEVEKDKKVKEEQQVTKIASILLSKYSSEVSSATKKGILECGLQSEITERISEPSKNRNCIARQFPFFIDFFVGVKNCKSLLSSRTIHCINAFLGKSLGDVDYKSKLESTALYCPIQPVEVKVKQRSKKIERNN